MDKKDTGTTAAQKFEVNGLQASTTYSFTVAAYNQSGAYSKESAAITATTHGLSGTASSSASSTASTASSSTDTVAPSVPVGLFANAVSTSEIDLSWTPSSDNTAVTGYRIFSNGTFIATSSASSYKSTGLLSGATYSYTVAAYDAAGNLSAQTASISATTQNPASNNTGSNASTTTNNNTTTADTTAPTTSITAPAAGATVSGTITVTASASDNVGVTKVEFYADGTLKGSVTALPYTFSLNTTSLSDGTHSVTAKAYDAAGNVGTSPSVSITVKNSTTNTTTTTATSTTTGTVPGTPTGLSATAISSSEIDLAWSAPANASGLTGYQIFRNGHPLAISSSASYKDTGLTSATGYSYTVTAYSSTPDNAGPHSASVSATTPSAGN
jgi:chitodextrinase